MTSVKEKEEKREWDLREFTFREGIEDEVRFQSKSKPKKKYKKRRMDAKLK
jgi:hypothetical protein